LGTGSLNRFALTKTVILVGRKLERVQAGDKRQARKQPAEKDTRKRAIEYRYLEDSFMFQNGNNYDD
jgi:hypothetical protein